MSLGATKGAAKAAEQKAQHEHEFRMTRMLLDWMEVARPQNGNVLVVRVPDEYYVKPGTPEDEVTAEQKEIYKQLGHLFQTLIEGLKAHGVVMAGGAVLRDGMRLEDLPPPGQRVERLGIVLPPGARI